MGITFETNIDLLFFHMIIENYERQLLEVKNLLNAIKHI